VKTISVEVVSNDRGTAIAVAGELDLSTAGRVERELIRAEQAQPAILALDLTGLEFIDSTGLRLVIAADARARKEGRRLVVVAGPPAVHRVFRIALLDRRLEFVEDAESIPWADDGDD
jgi:anti-sigma B factor antagonist